MIESMTGFGKATLQLNGKKITVEIKSLNSRNLDISARIPSEYKEKEMEIRQLLAQELVRGKISFNIFLEINGVDNGVKINSELVHKYIEELKAIDSNAQTNYLEIAMKLPETVSATKDELDDEEWSTVKDLIHEALVNIKDFRAEEGRNLEQDFIKRIELIGEYLENIKEFEKERISMLRERLMKSIEELQQKVDENRFEQELIYYLEKLDITEEKVRLKNHLDYFLDILESPESNGKKLGFIGQEIGREINTIGSKANFAPMQKLVVQMKDELEKIKEQSLNIL